MIPLYHALHKKWKKTAPGSNHLQSRQKPLGTSVNSSPARALCPEGICIHKENMHTQSVAEHPISYTSSPLHLSEIREIQLSLLFVFHLIKLLQHLSDTGTSALHALLLLTSPQGCMDHASPHHPPCTVSPCCLKQHLGSFFQVC